MIAILQDFPKLIAQILNSFFSKLVNNEIRLYRTQPTILIIVLLLEHYCTNNIFYKAIDLLFIKVEFEYKVN